MVTQDTSLLHRSVRDNIVYGRPTPATPRCCAPPNAPRRTTSSSTLVDQEGPQGYDAHVGERGVKLSGGSASASPSRA